MEGKEWLDGYLLSKPGAGRDYKEEWGWWRYRLDEKMFAAICRPGPEHAAYDGRWLLTLKCEPLMGELVRAEYPDIVPGFYMDKRHWISVFLDGEVPDELIQDLIDRSHALVFEKLSKKRQRELAAGAEG